MFQFRGLAHLAVCQVFYLTGCPIQKSPDRISFANPRSFSQLTTSFFASKSLGIPHTLFVTFLQLHIPLLSVYGLSHLLNHVNELCRSVSAVYNIEVADLYALSDVAIVLKR